MRRLRRAALRGVRHGVLLGVLVAPVAAGAQEPLALETFLARVRATHPVARQAELARRAQDAELTAARGGFDPYVAATWDVKRFKGIGYFDELDTRLVVPTPWGVDLKVGWERAAGQIINPERATPDEGLLSAGFSLPIGPRLVTDDRRTRLRQAELAQDAAEADRDAALARLMQAAARDFGAWVETHARLRVTREGEGLARFRLDAVRRRVDAGDAAAIDTVEAAAELERRTVQRLEAETAAQVARLVLETYLWSAEGRPEALPADATPGVVSLPAWALDGTPGGLASRLAAGHPAVRASVARWLQADATRRLSAVDLLPSASVEISGLAAGRSIGDLPAPRASGDDYKVGGSLRIPLLARRELGRLRAAEDRARSLAIERDKVRRDVTVQVERALAELRLVGEQLERQRRVLAGAEALLAAEQQRFETGESSLLIVNLRERSLLDERLRLAQLEGRRAAVLGDLAVATGRPQLPPGETPP